MNIRLHVQVTADDIERGKRCDSLACPIALAMYRATGAKWVVNEWSVRKLGCGMLPVGLPDNAVDFVRDYDSGNFPAPMEFDIEVTA